MLGIVPQKLFSITCGLTVSPSPSFSITTISITTTASHPTLSYVKDTSEEIDIGEYIEDIMRALVRLCGGSDARDGTLLPALEITPSQADRPLSSPNDDDAVGMYHSMLKIAKELASEKTLEPDERANRLELVIELSTKVRSCVFCLNLCWRRTLLHHVAEVPDHFRRQDRFVDAFHTLRTRTWKGQITCGMACGGCDSLG